MSQLAPAVPAASLCPTADADAGFIRWRGATLPGLPALPCVLARFRVPAYTVAQFALHGIGMPSAIRNSVPKRQAEFLAGRICARQALAGHGRPAAEVAIGTRREPLWPPGMIGSITHSGDHAAALACPAGALLGIGIDIERIAGADARQALTEQVVAPAEAAYLRSLTDPADPADFDTLLTLVFSAKESFFKAAFGQVGDYFDFDAVRVLHLDRAGGTLDLCCTRTLCASLPQGRICRAYFGQLDGATWLSAVPLRRDSRWL